MRRLFLNLKNYIFFTKFNYTLKISLQSEEKTVLFPHILNGVNTTVKGSYNPSKTKEDK